MSEAGRSVRDVPQDTATLLFEFEAPSVPVASPPVLVSTWTPPAPAPIAEPIPLLLLLPEPEPIQTVPAPSARPRMEAALPEWATALGVFDLETTGVDTATARIVTAHVGVIDETGAVVERKDWIVDPGVPIPAAAAAIHGVGDLRARRFGRHPGEVVAEILAAIRSVVARGFPLVVYNAPYDLTLLHAEAERHGLPPLERRADGPRSAGPRAGEPPADVPAARIVDPLVLDRQLDRFRRGARTLTATARVYGVELTDAHDAGADAIAAGRVAQAIARRYAAELGATAQEMHDLQIGWCADQAERFQAFMREQRDPAFTTSGAWPRR